MQWEQLTSSDFAQAVKDTGVCLITFGVVEKHSEHLPLGTDFLNGHRLACLAAEKEPAVVFPPFYFGQIYEARCFPGTVTLKPTLLIQVITGVLDEIGRNGFKKIIMVSAHGGNSALLPFLAQSSLWEQKPYTLYLFRGIDSEEDRKVWKETVETELHGHACECETSISLANHPHLVHMDRVPEPEVGATRGRLKDVKGGMSGIWWYGDYPEHYAGDARTASAEKGRILQGLQVKALAKYIKAVKEDTVTAELENEFFAREAKLRE
jgi:creatinine amidohydrolase